VSARRLFIGLMASPAAQAAIDAYRLKWHWPPTARLVALQKLHLTLHFLGEVEGTDEARLCAAMVAVRMHPLHLRLVAPETFSGGIAVLKAAKNRQLELLHADTAAVLRGAGLPVDMQAWNPHVTLARGAKECLPPVEPPAIEMEARSFSLVCSRPDQGRSHDVIESWPRT